MTTAPYPVAASDAVSQRMRRNRSSDTKLELSIRSALHRSGLRFRKGLRIHAGEVNVRPDIVFTRARVAVFLDGDFWHGWRFGRWEIKLQPFWRKKIARNRARDASNFKKLRRQGWRVLRIWEHELERDLARQVERILGAVATRRRKPPRTASPSPHPPRATPCATGGSGASPTYLAPPVA